MLNIPDIATKWGHIFGGINQIDTFRGTTLKTRADTIAGDYTTAAELRLAAEGLYQEVQTIDTGLNDAVDFFFTMSKNTLQLAAILDSNFPIATDDTSLITKFINDAVAQAQTFQLPTVTVNGASTAAGTPVTTLQGAPFGTGAVYATVIEPRTAVVRYYTYAETIKVTCTADSYQSGTTPGQETFSVQTYSSVDADNSLWPKGAGVSTSMQSQPSSAGTLLQNAYFDNWDSVTPNTLLNWTVNGLVPGVTIFQDTADPYVHLSSVRFTAAPLNSEITQPINGLAGAQNYLAALRVKREGGVTGGVITVALRDSTGTILNDAAGNPMSFTIALTGAGGGAGPAGYFVTVKLFPVPRGFPTTVFYSIKFTTAMNAAESIDVATAELIPMQNVYLGGEDIAFLPGYQGWAINDTYTFTAATSAGKATFVKLLDRLYNTRARGIDLPVAGIPTISDGLIV